MFCKHTLLTFFTSTYSFILYIIIVLYYISLDGHSRLLDSMDKNEELVGEEGKGCEWRTFLK